MIEIFFARFLGPFSGGDDRKQSMILNGIKKTNFFVRPHIVVYSKINSCHKIYETNVNIRLVKKLKSLFKFYFSSKIDLIVIRT